MGFGPSTAGMAQGAWGMAPTQFVGLGSNTRRYRGGLKYVECIGLGSNPLGMDEASRVGFEGMEHGSDPRRMAQTHETRLRPTPQLPDPHHVLKTPTLHVLSTPTPQRSAPPKAPGLSTPRRAGAPRRAGTPRCLLRGANFLGKEESGSL